MWFFTKWRKKEIEIKEDKAEFWNNKYPRKDIIYRVRNRKGREGISFDVRNFIVPKDAILSTIAKTLMKEGMSNDEKAYACMKWVIDNIKYNPDLRQFNFEEHWLFPAETLYYKKGDCEDGTHLMISLMRNAEIPAYRCKATVGYANNGKQKFYHSYPIYLREKDDEWVVLDWNSAEISFLPVEFRLLAKNNPFYDRLDYTFNDEHSWSQNNFIIENGHKK